MIEHVTFIEVARCPDGGFILKLGNAENKENASEFHIDDAVAEALGRALTQDNTLRVGRN